LVYKKQNINEYKEREDLMEKFANCVRCCVKEGCEEKYLEMVNSWGMAEGQERAYTVKTGDREYIFFGVWDSEESLINARSEMIGNLDSIRDLLEKLSDDLGVTEPRSGFIKSSINP